MLQRILLVDDERLIRRVVTRMLRDYDVIEAGTGNEALAHMLGGDFAVVLCDVGLPDMTGTDVLRWARRLRPGLAERFVMFTGDVRIDPEFDVPTLLKPFSVEGLKAVIATIVNARVARLLEPAA